MAKIGILQLATAFMGDQLVANKVARQDLVFSVKLHSGLTLILIPYLMSLKKSDRIWDEHALGPKNNISHMKKI